MGIHGEGSKPVVFRCEVDGHPFVSYFRCVPRYLLIHSHLSSFIHFLSWMLFEIPAKREEPCPKYGEFRKGVFLHGLVGNLGNQWAQGIPRLSGKLCWNSSLPHEITLRTEYDPVWPSHRQPCYLVSLGILPSQILGLNTVVAIAAPEVQPGETLKRWAVRNTLWRSGAQKLLHRIQDIHNLLQSISVHGSWSTTRTAIGTGKSMKSGLIMSGHEFGPGSPELCTLVCRGGSGDQHAMWIDQNRDSTIKLLYNQKLRL